MSYNTYVFPAKNCLTKCCSLVNLKWEKPINPKYLKEKSQPKQSYTYTHRPLC